MFVVFENLDEFSVLAFRGSQARLVALRLVFVVRVDRLPLPAQPVRGDRLARVLRVVRRGSIWVACQELVPELRAQALGAGLPALELEGRAGQRLARWLVVRAVQLLHVRVPEGIAHRDPPRRASQPQESFQETDRRDGFRYRAKMQS